MAVVVELDCEESKGLWIDLAKYLNIGPVTGWLVIFDGQAADME
jgi:hypothetical protein